VIEAIKALSPISLPPGLTLLTGAPKAEKSLLALQLCMAVAGGQNFLGEKQTNPLFST